ncbi:MAG TPA: alanine racemase [Lachnospiraceae bacterium]|nr:alanine racemase [Lachnospiraceae bacterium]
MKDYYRVKAVISKDALVHNIRLIKNKLGPVRMMAVVKSNAYGHDIRNVIPVCSDQGVDAYAVATLEEGVEVRSLLDRLPSEWSRQHASMILVLGYTDPSEYDRAIRNKIDLAVYSLEQAEALSKEAVRLDQRAGLHIKLETGMQRIGFDLNDQSLQDIKAISTLPNLSINGVFSHFARADEKDKSHADLQWERYQAFTDRLERAGVRIKAHHIANSAAIMEYPQAYTQPLPEGEYWMARAGIILYGLYPSDEMDRQAMPLEPVMSLYTHVVHLKTVPAGTPIGYGGAYVTTRPSRIATITVGYGDGYPRHLSDKGYVYVRGQKAPIRGRVCMDQTMIDVTDIKDVQLLDEVELIGPHVPLDDLADLSGTIHYEIICQLTDRIPRILR